MLAAIRTGVNDYAKTKTWYWYLPVWLFGFYLFTQLLGFGFGKPLPFFVSVAYGADFMLHELAHIFTTFLPDIFTAAAGSVSELLLGLGLVVGAFLTRAYFASLFCFLWFMLACHSAGSYMADASTQAIPLVSLGGGDNATHDWNFVFSKLNLLDYDTLIGGTLKAIGTIIGVFGLLFAAWVIYKIAVTEEDPGPSKKEAELLSSTISDEDPRKAPLNHYEKMENEELYPTVTRGPLAEHANPTEKPKK